MTKRCVSSNQCKPQSFSAGKWGACKLLAWSILCQLCDGYVVVLLISVSVTHTLCNTVLAQKSLTACSMVHSGSSPDLFSVPGSILNQPLTDSRSLDSFWINTWLILGGVDVFSHTTSIHVRACPLYSTVDRSGQGTLWLVGKKKCPPSIFLLFIFFFPVSQKIPCRDLSAVEYSDCGLMDTITSPIHATCFRPLQKYFPCT